MSTGKEIPIVLVYTWIFLNMNVVKGFDDGHITIGPGPSSSLELRLQPPRVSIVLVGGQSFIQVQCALPNYHYRLQASPLSTTLVKVLTEDVLLNATVRISSLDDEKEQQFTSIQLLGLRPGRTKLQFSLLHANDRTVVQRLSWDFEVVVVERLNVLKDGFLYLLLAAQMAALSMLIVRMRGTAVKEVLKRPCALFSAIFCQAVLVPLICIGISVSLGLPLHAVVCLLILGCCPTGTLSPMLTVIQQGHVELAILVLIIETCASFGIMPLWLFAYGNFLGLAHDHVNAPYYFIAGALVYIAIPLIMGFIIQKISIIIKVAPGSFQLLDRAIAPSCLLLMLLEFTVNATAFAAVWDAVTWRLLAGSALVPMLGGILGTICSATFRQELPQAKTVTIVTCIQNTILAKVIIQISYPVPDASVMVLVLTCVNFFTICYMLLAYIPHLSLMLCWPAYRPLHQHSGIGGLQDSIGDRIVRSMVKAGEITFGKLQQSPVFKRVMGSEVLSQTDIQQAPFSSLKGRLLYTSNTLDSAYRSGLSSSKCSTPTGYPLKYFTDIQPAFLDQVCMDTSGLRLDSLESLDYEMLSEGEHPTERLDSWSLGTANEKTILKKETEEDVVAMKERQLTPLPEWPSQKHSVPRFDSLDVQKPLPPLPLPKTPPYMSRRLSCSDEGLHWSEVNKVSAAQPFLHPSKHCAHRTRHASANSSKSVHSDATDNTSVSLHPGDMEDLSESVSTILASYDMSIMAAAAGGSRIASRGTVSTRWCWETGSDAQYSPPPPNSSPAKGVSNDLSSIEEERSMEGSQQRETEDNVQPDIYIQGPPSYNDSVRLSHQ